MADPRLSVSASPSPAARVSTPAASETVRAAQRAFFEAALRQAPTQAKPSQAVSSAMPASRVEAAQASTVSTGRVAVSGVGGASPQRLLRPGSLLDIRV